ncbi:MAG: TatD family hydrolase [Bacteroidota bacterium]
MSLIDTHTHLYSREFDSDRNDLIRTAIAEGVGTFIMPDIDSKWTSAMLEVAATFPGVCLPMSGLHPCSVAANYRDELKHVEKNLGTGNFFAVGEMGIDLHWDKTYIKEQDAAFEVQCKWADELKLPVAIHSREATTHVIQLIHKLNLPSLTGVFHCFGGTPQEAEEIKKMGFMMGIGGVVTYKNGGLDKTLPHIPTKYIVLETDAPYLTPVPHRGKRNEPAYIKLIAEKVASIYGVTVDEITKITSDNAKKLFKL